MPRFGFKHPVTGEAIAHDDGRLIGMGNPPCAPGPIGHGQIQLVPVMLTDAEAEKADKAKAAHAATPGSRRRGHFPEFKPE